MLEKTEKWSFQMRKFRSSHYTIYVFANICMKHVRVIVKKKNKMKVHKHKKCLILICGNKLTFNKLEMNSVLMVFGRAFHGSLVLAITESLFLTASMKLLLLFS